MKKFNLIKRLWTDSHEKQTPQRFGRYAAMLIMLLTLGVGQMWGASTVNGGEVYFDASQSGWSVSDVQFVIGHNSYSNFYNMTSIGNTNLYYISAASWGDATYFAFANGCSGWGAEGNKYADRTKYISGKYSAAKTSYTLNSGSTYLFYTSSSSNNASINTSSPAGYLGAGKTYADLNYTQTLNQTLSTNGGSTYSASTLSLATVTVSSYKLNGASSSTADEGTIEEGESSATCDAARSATVTYSVSDVTTGYDFVGWYDGSTQKSTSTSYSYTSTGTKTITARFKQKQYTVSYGVYASSRWGSMKLNSGSSVSTTSSSTLNHGTTLSFTATPNSGYQVEGWYSDAACAVKDRLQEGGTSYNGGTLTAATTVYVKFKVRTGGTITLSAGSNGQVSADNSTWGTTKTITDVTTATDVNIYAQGNTGYQFSSWTKSSGSGNVKTNAASGVFTTVAYEDATVTASFSEIMRTITISGGTVYGGAATSTTAGVATSAKITANAPAAGKKFTGWTLGTGVSLKAGSSLTDRTIEIYSTANATVTANYADRASVKVYFAKPSGWSTVYAHAWKDGGTGTTWPGVNITSNTETINYVTYYYLLYYTEADGIGNAATGSDTWDEVKFSDNGDGTKRTADLSLVNGHYYFKSTGEGTSGKTAALTSAWCIKGSFNSWSEDADQITHSAAATGSKSITLTTGNKTFKIYNIVNETWWRFSGNVTATKAATAMDNSDGDMTITPSVAGPYTFALASLTGTPTLAITYPTSYTVTFNAETFVNGGASHSTSTTGGTLSAVDGNSAALSSGGKVISGGSAVITASKADGYTFIGFYTNAACTTAVSGAGVSISDNVLTYTGISGNKTVYAKFSENMTSVSLVASPTGKGTFTKGGAAVTSVSAGKTTKPEVTAVPATGYRVNTSATVWAKNNSNITLSSTTANPVTVTGAGTGGTSTLTATFTPKTYTITLNNHGATTAGTTSVGVTYNATTGLTSDITCPEKTGYTFGGYYTEEGGSGTQLISAAGKWQKGNSWINAGGSWVNDGNVELHAKWTANTYTVSFNVNGGSASTPDSKSVTYDAPYGELPDGMTHVSKTFVGWYTDPDDGEGDLITAETIVSTASDHTLYAHYENVYSVNVTFKCGSTTIYPSTSVNASPTSLAPTITAPEIFGYSFVNWTGDDVTPASATSATTTITATAATTITANYAEVPTVYFKNNLGWDSVFVSFNITWAEKGGKQVPVNKDKPYYKMTQIGSSDIYYCVIPSTYTANNYAGWAWNIAFDNTNYGKTATTTHSGTWNEFYGGECVGRGDFDPKATLYIPYNGDTETRNTAKFYKTGCWMKYNSTESGYQVNMNTIVTGSNADTCTVKLTAASAGGYEFSAKIKLHRANYTYGFKLYKIYQKNTSDLWYTNTGTIYANTETLPWDFHSGTDVTSTSTRCGLHTEALGDYTITVSFGTGRPMVTVEYPASVGDWRLDYNDRIAWSGDTHDASWHLYSRVIKAKANAVDTVSFYVSKATGANASVELQKCTAIDAGTGAETWTKQSDVDLTGITGTGIYNFKVTQNGSKVASAAVAGGYVGNFYIRTDASDGGWSNYKVASNIMTYSEYAENNHDFTHYYMCFVNTGTNIKFCIANDYSSCLTEECIDDDFTGEYIEAYGNVRYMWDHRTNKVSRAYISGSAYAYDRFLVLEGDAKLFDKDGNALTTAGGGKISGLNDYEMNFSDDQNWIYEATVKAIPGAKFKLTAKYNNKIQYFYGDEGSDPADSVLLLGGSDGNKYKMRIVYDFKTNRLIKAFIPDGDISADLAIKADMMIIRDHQNDAQQVTFNGGSLSDVETVYGALMFNKYTVNGKERTGGHASTSDSRYKRDLFYISFPFDVKLSDAFGFGTYGKHWIIEYYDGKGRAANGFWADSDPNWKFVMPSQRHNFTMKAFEGYILALDLDEMTESSDVWDKGVENVYVYFPSSAHVENIAATNRTIEIDQTDYECKINRATLDGDRRVKDSYWHCIGVPSFANYSRDLYDTNGGTKIDWRSTSMPYLYEWNPADNSLSITSSATFSFKATWSYLVQYAGESIYWSAVNVTPSSIVARERTAPKNAEFRIELQKAGEKADQTFVRLTEEENVTTGFDFNYDLSKEFNKNKANIYTMVTTIMDDGPSVTETAGNCLPLTDQTTVVPMGMTIAQAGDYTISIPGGTNGVGVTLIDSETGIRTNLALEDYNIALDADTYDNRFLLEISSIKNTPTGIDNIDESQNSNVRKVMVDGTLYIIKDGKVFDAQGVRVK